VRGEVRSGDLARLKKRCTSGKKKRKKQKKPKLKRLKEGEFKTYHNITDQSVIIPKYT
jgi:hypothetical protein